MPKKDFFEFAIFICCDDCVAWHILETTVDGADSAWTILETIGWILEAITNCCDDCVAVVVDVDGADVCSWFFKDCWKGAFVGWNCAK